MDGAIGGWDGPADRPAGRALRPASRPSAPGPPGTPAGCRGVDTAPYGLKIPRKRSKSATTTSHAQLKARRPQIPAATRKAAVPLLAHSSRTRVQAPAE